MSNQFRRWEYKSHGDYHRNLDPNWYYTPTYLQKLKYLRRWLNKLSNKNIILDVGCGEGTIVEEYRAEGWNIYGVDLNYGSHFVTPANILAIPFEDKYFDIVLLMDVFEHLSYADQPLALKEISRVLKKDGLMFASIPNLAHLDSRFKLLLFGDLHRTDIETNHIGERTYRENVNILSSSGFQIKETYGITITIPILYKRLIYRNPKKYRWLHDVFELIKIPSIAMNNIFICKKVVTE